MASDKTNPCKTKDIENLLFKAWRERWSDIQWSIQLKTIIPRGVSRDVFNLSKLVLEQVLIGPIPNQLMLSYLRHSLAAQTIGHGSLLDSIVSQSDAAKLKSRPHCTTALLDLVKLTTNLVSKRSKPEECLTLNRYVCILTYLFLIFLSKFLYKLC